METFYLETFSFWRLPSLELFFSSPPRLLEKLHLEPWKNWHSKNDELPNLEPENFCCGKAVHLKKIFEKFSIWKLFRFEKILLESFPRSYGSHQVYLESFLEVTNIILLASTATLWCAMLCHDVALFYAIMCYFAGLVFVLSWEAAAQQIILFLQRKSSLPPANLHFIQKNKL